MPLPARLPLPTLATVRVALAVVPTRATRLAELGVTDWIGATPVAFSVVTTDPPAFEAFVPFANVVVTAVEAAPTFVGANV